MLGPMSQVDAAYNFNAQGETLAEGATVPRRFAANEYEVYFQDQWRLHPSLTLNLGLRYRMPLRRGRQTAIRSFLFP